MVKGVTFVLFPGRHHLLTRSQATFLHELLAGRTHDGSGHRVEVHPQAAVVWAVTSANHQNTRRNPVPYSQREAAIERFSLLESVQSLVIPVVDARATARFAHVTLTAVEIATAGRALLTPQNTVLACSTPQVAGLYADLGFRVVCVEADTSVFDRRPPGPGTSWSSWSRATRVGGSWHTRPAWTCWSATPWTSTSGWCAPTPSWATRGH